jgi:hypothetical protein
MKQITKNRNIDFIEIEKLHINAWEQKIEQGLATLLNARFQSVKLFYTKIYNNRKVLLTGKPADLRLAKQEIENAKKNILPLVYKFMNINKKLAEVFDYAALVESYLPHWGAYKFVQQLDVRSCSYCNRVFTFTLDKVDQARMFNKARRTKEKKKILYKITSGKTRPELDHFYPQAKFPYLALAIYNLVPSCHICNSNLKGSRDIDFDNLINPYEDDFDELIKIKVKLRNEANIQKEIDAGNLAGEVRDYFGYSLFTGKLESFDLVFERVNPPDSVINTKVAKHIDLYALNELYAMHKDHVSRILKNAIIHGPGSAKDLYSRHKNLFHSEEEARSVILGTESNPENINQFPLSKLAIDICEEFGI